MHSSTYFVIKKTQDAYFAWFSHQSKSCWANDSWVNAFNRCELASFLSLFHLSNCSTPISTNFRTEISPARSVLDRLRGLRPSSIISKQTLARRTIDLGWMSTRSLIRNNEKCLYPYEMQLRRSKNLRLLHTLSFIMIRFVYVYILSL